MMSRIEIQGRRIGVMVVAEKIAAGVRTGSWFDGGGVIFRRDSSRGGRNLMGVQRGVGLLVVEQGGRRQVIVAAPDS